MCISVVEPVNFDFLVISPDFHFFRRGITSQWVLLEVIIGKVCCITLIPCDFYTSCILCVQIISYYLKLHFTFGINFPSGQGYSYKVSTQESSWTLERTYTFDDSYQGTVSIQWTICCCADIFCDIYKGNKELQVLVFQIRIKSWL